MRLKRRTLLVLGGWTMAASAASGQNGPKSLLKGELLADYFQIYVRDQGRPDLPATYSEEAISARLTVGPHAVVVHTARNMTVPFIVEWHDVRPQYETERYQHVVEASFNCPSGVLVLAGMTDYEPTAPKFSVTAGALGIRVNMSGLDTISEDGLDGRDRYLIQLWPGQELSGPLVLKSWAER
jgi:hypothetical protein